MSYLSSHASSTSSARVKAEMDLSLLTENAVRLKQKCVLNGQEARHKADKKCLILSVRLIRKSLIFSLKHDKEELEIQTVIAADQAKIGVFPKFNGANAARSDTGSKLQPSMPNTPQPTLLQQLNVPFNTAQPTVQHSNAVPLIPTQLTTDPPITLATGGYATNYGYATRDTGLPPTTVARVGQHEIAETTKVFHIAISQHSNL